MNNKTLKLIDSIRAGYKPNPIKVTQTTDGRFKIRDGRHRLLAFKMLGQERIDCKFFDNNYDKEAHKISLN